MVDRGTGEEDDEFGLMMRRFDALEVENRSLRARLDQLYATGASPDSSPPAGAGDVTDNDDGVFSRRHLMLSGGAVVVATGVNIAARTVRAPNHETGDSGLEAPDTKWRDVSSLLVSGLSPSSNKGCARMRRIGDVIHYDFKLDIDTPAGVGTYIIGTPRRLPGWLAPDLSAGVDATQLAMASISTSPGKNYCETPHVLYAANAALRCFRLPDPGTFQAYGNYTTDQLFPTDLSAYPEIT